ncbi:MAG TPA: hypothetical protein ENO24_00915 [Chloroflexi bacterium]|nr:hypothetical protein [Chloroflexota bacterium]
MKLPFEPAFLQYLIVIVTALAASTAVGLKRGWRGELMAFVPIVAIWALLGATKERLVGSMNVAYRSLRFFLACGSQANTGSCVQSSGLANAMLVDPSNPEQVRLLVLAVFICAVALIFVLVFRFGRRPSSIWQRLLGALLGVANGFTLSYLMLPLLSYREQITLPVASASAEGDLSLIGPSLPSSLSVPSVTVGAVFLVLFVPFVIVAVRLMRPIEFPVKYYGQDR